MKKVYQGKEEILKAITSDGTISGVVEMDFKDILHNTEGMDFINEKATNLLVGEDYGYLVEDISYKIVGVDVEKQTIFIEINASASSLQREIE